MEKIVSDFAEYLSSHLNIQIRLAELASEETRVLIKRNMIRLEEILEEKRKVLAEIESQEKTLSGFQRKLSAILTENKKQSLTLSEICNLLSPSLRPPLEDLRLKLKTILNKTTRTHKINAALIKHHLDYSAFYLRKLESLSNKNVATYSSSGRMTSSKGGTSILFQQRL